MMPCIIIFIYIWGRASEVLNFLFSPWASEHKRLDSNLLCATFQYPGQPTTAGNLSIRRQVKGEVFARPYKCYI